MTVMQEQRISASLSRKLPGTDLTVGVIGCGYWGPKLARNFHELPGARLKMVSDMRQDRLDGIKQLYPEVSVTRNYQELFGDEVDAVVIATPVATHYELALAALRAGKHVLVEKPLTAGSAQAQELTDLAAKEGLTLMVGHTFMYNPAVEAVRELVQSHELGHIYYLDASRVNLGLLQRDINVMWDLGPHDISMMRYILGSDPVKVSAHGGTYVSTRSGLHEVVYMMLVFQDGVMAKLRMSWLDPVKQRRLTIVGSKKMLVYDDVAEDGRKVVLYDKGIDLPVSVTEDAFQAVYRHGEETAYPLAWAEPLGAECRHFVECIASGAEPRSSGSDGVKVIKVLETAQRSLMNGGVELYIEY